MNILRTSSTCNRRVIPGDSSTVEEDLGSTSRARRGLGGYPGGEGGVLTPQNDGYAPTAVENQTLRELKIVKNRPLKS